MEVTKNIPEELYKQILEVAPIACVDLAVYDEEKGFLLVLRGDEPAKGKWWTPGGRIFKNETLEVAALRKAREEIGIETRIIAKLRSYDFFQKDFTSRGIKTGLHTISAGFLLEPVDKSEIALDRTSHNYKWVKEVDTSYHPFVLDIISDAREYLARVSNRQK